MEILEILAPAKINLTLDVLGKVSNGYHKVEMVMQSVSLADRLTFLPKQEGITITCDHSDVPVDERNLVYRTACMLQEQYNIHEGVAIRIQKNIPVGAGLAGGSTDAAATLKGLNTLWQLNLKASEMLQMAVKLGADVSFCLFGGTALATGIGEKLMPLTPLPKLWLVLAKPDFSVSTAWAYRELDKLSEIQHPHTCKMLDAIEKQDAGGIVQYLGNVLEQVTSLAHPQIEHLKGKLSALGAQGVLMSGSGPTVFGIMPNEKAAQKAAAVLKRENKEVFVVHTIGKF